jgi:phage-related protein
VFAQHPWAAWPWAGGLWQPFTPTPPLRPDWPAEWCAALGPSRSATLKVDTNEFGDGYCHRSTRGLDPVKPAWTLSFPATSDAVLLEMDAFLRTFGQAGFTFTPPGDSTAIFVTCDAWTFVLTDRSAGGDLISSLQATFTEVFNHQPPDYPP